MKANPLIARMEKLRQKLTVIWTIGLFLFILETVQGALPTNWHFITPLPQGNDLKAVWAPAVNDVYAGGPGGLIQHWNGTNWTQITNSTTKTIYAIHGLSTKDIWVVGGDAYTTNITNRCLILHYDGTKWSEMAAPKYSGWTYPLSAVYAVGPKDVWATTDTGTFPVHYDGTSWKFVTLPLLLDGSLNAITSVSGGHLFFVGTHGQIVQYYNGTWTLEQKTESGNFSVNLLQTIWGTDLNNLYAGGNWGQMYRRNSDGTWKDLEMVAGLMEGFGIQKIWGPSSNHIYLISSQAIRHYDGSNVTKTNSFSNSMRLQWCDSSGVDNVIYGVGYSGIAHEFALDGQGGGVLSAMTVGGESQLSLSVSGGTACGSNGVLLYGSSLYRENTQPLVFFDGYNLHDFPVLPDGMTEQTTISAASAASLNDIVIAWDNFLTFDRGVSRWNGQIWESMGNSWEQPTDAVGFWRSTNGGLYACCTWRVMKWDGSNAWNTLYTVPNDSLQNTAFSSIWGRSEKEIYIGITNGTVLRFDGQTFKIETTPTNGIIRKISGNTTNTYAVGDNGLALQRVNGVWKFLAGVDQREGDNFTQLVSAPDGVYAAQQTPSIYIGGGMGLIWRFKGTSAALVVNGLSQPIEVLEQCGGYLYGISTQSFVVSDRPVSNTENQMRVNLSSTNWVTLGTSDVELRPAVTSNGKPMVVAKQIDVASSFFWLAVPKTGYGSQHWLLQSETTYGGQSFPSVYLRFHYDPTRLPAGFDSSACLYHYDGSSWTAVAASFDTTLHTVTTLTPQTTGEWTIGLAPVVPTELKIVSDGAKKLQISWPVSVTGVQLESTSDLASGVWTQASEVPSVNGESYQVTIDATDQTRFYRLRR